MQTATSETESKSLHLSIYAHHCTLREPCPKGQGKTIIIHGPNFNKTSSHLWKR